MQKGVVIESGKNWTVVLTPEGEFCKIPFEPQHCEGMEVFFRSVATPATFQGKRLKASHLRYISAVAACLLLLVLIFPLFNGSQAYAAVTIDINPSIELEVDDQAIVIDAHPLNDDGKKVLAGIQWDKEKLATVTLEIIQDAEKNGLMNNQGQVIITTAFYNEESKEVNEKWNSMLEGVSSNVDDQVTLVLVTGKKQWYDEAKKKDVSPGSYTIIKKAEENGIHLQLDDIKKGAVDLPPVPGVKVIHPKHPKPPILAPDSKQKDEKEKTTVPAVHPNNGNRHSEDKQDKPSMENKENGWEKSHNNNHDGKAVNEEKKKDQDDQVKEHDDSAKHGKWDNSSSSSHKEELNHKQSDKIEKKNHQDSKDDDHSRAEQHLDKDKNKDNGNGKDKGKEDHSNNGRDK